MEEGSGRQVPEVKPTEAPTLLEQHDSAESNAGGASERFGIKSTPKTTVIDKSVRCSDVLNPLGATPMRFEPKRWSICLNAAH